MNPAVGINSTDCTLPSQPYRITLGPYTSPGAEHTFRSDNLEPDPTTFGWHPLPERGPQRAATSSAVQPASTAHTGRPLASLSVHRSLFINICRWFRRNHAIVVKSVTITTTMHHSATRDRLEPMFDLGASFDVIGKS